MKLSLGEYPVKGISLSQVPGIQVGSETFAPAVYNVALNGQASILVQSTADIIFE